MVRLMELIFGEPVKGSGYYRFVYWLVIIFYFIGMIGLTLYAFRNGGWYYLGIPGLGFPLVFRLLKKLNEAFFKGIQNVQLKDSITLITGILSVLCLMSLGAIMMSSNFHSSSVVKTVNNGELQMSIGDLTGFQVVETFETENTGSNILSLPYKVSVGEGGLSMRAVRDGEIVWKERVSPSGAGTISLDADGSEYEIVLYSDQAKNIKLNLGSTP